MKLPLILERVVYLAVVALALLALALVGAAPSGFVETQVVYRGF